MSTATAAASARRDYYYGHREVMARSEVVLCKVVLWMLRHPGERINVSAVPMVP